MIRYPSAVHVELIGPENEYDPTSNPYGPTTTAYGKIGASHWQKHLFTVKVVFFKICDESEHFWIILRGILLSRRSVHCLLNCPVIDFFLYKNSLRGTWLWREPISYKTN